MSATAGRLRRWGPPAARGLGLGVAALALAPIAYRALFGLFADYDDEGYVLVSLQGHLRGAPLYDDVYSQYGPFFFVWWGGVFRLLGLSLDHDTSRAVTLVLWMGTGLLAAFAVLRVTRSFLIGVGVLVMVLATQRVLVNEPMHPGGLLSLLLLGVVAAALFALPSAPRAGMVAIGALAAFAALVKINVGALAFMAAGFACAVAVEPLRRHRVIPLLAGALLVATPFALMSGDLGQDWALHYGLHVAMAALGVALVTSSLPASPSLALAHVAWLAGGAAAAAALILLTILVGGTSVEGLLDGVVLGPLRQREAFSLPLIIPVALLPLAAGGLAGAAITALLRTRRGRHGASTPFAAVARLLAGLFIWVAGSGVWARYGPPFAMAMPLAWVASVPLPRDHEYLPVLIRALLPALAVLQTLHAYPVAGSQTAWSALLLVPVGAICVADGLAGLGAWARRRSGPAASRLLRGAAMLPVALFPIWLVWLQSPHYSSVVDGYKAGVAPGLPGTERLRLPREQVGVYRKLTEEIDHRCSTFISIPGLNSLYLFTETEPPTWLNATAWMFLFDAPTQRRIVERVAPIEDLCVIRHFGLVEFWRQGRPIPQRPLVRYIDERFTQAAVQGPFEVLVRRRNAPRP